MSTTPRQAFWHAVDALDSAALYGERPIRPAFHRCARCESPMVRIDADLVGCPHCAPLRTCREPARYRSAAELVLTVLRTFVRMKPRHRKQAVNMLRALAVVNADTSASDD